MECIWGNEIDWNGLLWRYLKVDRFCELVENSKIYFAAAAQFPDPFEGAVAVIPPNIPIDPRYHEMDPLERAFFDLKELTKINCWHRADYESDAMWKLYADTSKGVAICSTPKLMQTSFREFRLAPKYGVEKLIFGDVRYEDLLQVRLKTEMLERFFYKHQAFSWEREFRLAISLRMASEFGVSIPQHGIEVSAQLDTLIDKIVLGPKLSESDKEKIIECATKAGLKGQIVFSSLLGKPKYV